MYNAYVSTGFKPPLSVLVDCIKAQGEHITSIGVELEHIPASTLSALVKTMPKVKFKDIGQAFRRMRTTKTAEEIALLRKVITINEKALKAAIESIRAGCSETEIRQIYVHEVVRRKAKPLFYYIYAGKNGPYNVPLSTSDHILRNGDVIRLDCACMYDGYCADQARSLVIGPLTPTKRRILRTVYDACRETISTLRAGLPVKDVFETAVRYVRHAGIRDYSRVDVGHGLGVEPREDPLLSPTSKECLQTDMIVNVEIPYYCIGLGAFTAEDSVRITAHGFECLTHPDNAFQAD
jgi:Xaa-Pro aminopeptidase